MTRKISISHQRHPARQQGKSIARLTVIKYCLAANKKLAIGTTNVDALYVQVRLMYPEVKLTKCNGYLLVEQE